MLSYLIPNYSSGLRAILNYSHMVAHALENVASYGTWLHGEIALLDMVVAAVPTQ